MHVCLCLCLCLRVCVSICMCMCMCMCICIYVHVTVYVYVEHHEFERWFGSCSILCPINCYFLLFRDSLVRHVGFAQLTCQLSCQRRRTYVTSESQRWGSGRPHPIKASSGIKIRPKKRPKKRSKESKESKRRKAQLTPVVSTEMAKCRCSTLERVQR